MQVLLSGIDDLLMYDRIWVILDQTTTWYLLTIRIICLDALDATRYYTRLLLLLNGDQRLLARWLNICLVVARDFSLLKLG